MSSLVKEISKEEIVLSIVLLKPGEGKFKLEDLQRGIKKYSKADSRLEITPREINETLFSYHKVLYGKPNPDYELNEEGRRIFQEKFDKYDIPLQNELKNIAEKVWKYSETQGNSAK